jgi:flagellar biosynthesis protein FlhA
MSIDSDLNAGLIDESEAEEDERSWPAKLSSTVPWMVLCGSRSGMPLQVLLITVINILAGFLIGVIQHGMDLTKALQTYTILTIGDGLVTVIPALMISVCGALIITRAWLR